MSKQPCIPDPETSKRLLANLRKTRLQMREFNLELESRERQLERVRRSLANLESSN
jgi:hypothetical protein